MADNQTIDNGGSPFDASADDVQVSGTPGSAKVQYVKLVDGTNGGTVPIKGNADGSISSYHPAIPNTGNSSTSNLGAGAAFTGTGVDVSDYTTIGISIYSSHASATDGLSIQFSSDNSTWRVSDTYTIPATTLRTITLRPQLQYFRLVYTNGGTLTTTLDIKTRFHTSPVNASSQRPSDTVSNENDFEMAMAALLGWNGSTWNRVQTTAGGEQRVMAHRDLARISVQSAGLTTATTAYSVGDQVGTQFTFAGAARASGGTGTVVGAMVIDAQDIIGPYDLVLFRSSVTLASDNAAFAISDADALNLIGVIQMAGAIDLGNNRIAQAYNLAMPYDCSGGTSLFGALVTRSAHTFFAGGVGSLQVILQVERN